MYKGHAANVNLAKYINSLPPTQFAGINIALPKKFDGSSKKFRGFLRQVEMFFLAHPEDFKGDGEKYAFWMSFLTEKAINLGGRCLKNRQRVLRVL